jgi:hypothetical protein
LNKAQQHTTHSVLGTTIISFSWNCIDRFRFVMQTCDFYEVGTEALNVIEVNFVTFSRENTERLCHYLIITEWKISWHVDPLLGNDRKMSNYTAAFAK